MMMFAPFVSFATDTLTVKLSVEDLQNTATSMEQQGIRALHSVTLFHPISEVYIKIWHPSYSFQSLF